MESPSLSQLHTTEVERWQLLAQTVKVKLGDSGRLLARIINILFLPDYPHLQESRDHTDRAVCVTAATGPKLEALVKDSYS